MAGHSFGALLAARVAAARQDFGAFVSLGGGFINFDSDTLPALQAITQPSFFMWGKGDDLVLANEDLDGTLKLWDKLGQTKYAAVYQGEHFDYLPATDTPSIPFHGPMLAHWRRLRRPGRVVPVLAHPGRGNANEDSCGVETADGGAHAGARNSLPALIFKALPASKREQDAGSI